MAASTPLCRMCTAPSSTRAAANEVPLQFKSYCRPHPYLCLLLPSAKCSTSSHMLCSLSPHLYYLLGKGMQVFARAKDTVDEHCRRHIVAVSGKSYQVPLDEVKCLQFNDTQLSSAGTKHYQHMQGTNIGSWRTAFKTAQLICKLVCNLVRNRCGPSNQNSTTSSPMAELLKLIYIPVCAATGSLSVLLLAQSSCSRGHRLYSCHVGVVSATSNANTSPGYQSSPEGKVGPELISFSWAAVMRTLCGVHWVRWDAQEQLPLT